MTLTWPMTSIGQTNTEVCEAPRRCRSADEVNAVAQALCARARVKETLYDQLRQEADGLMLDVARCEGATELLEAQQTRLRNELAQLQAKHDQRVGKWWVVAAASIGAVIGGVFGLMITN